MDLEILLTNKSGLPMIGFDHEQNVLVLMAPTASGSDGGGLPPLEPAKAKPFTPVLSGTAGAADQVYAQQVGWYVTVAGLVWISGTVQLSALGTINGDVLLGGLPVDVDDASGAIAVPVFSGLATRTANIAGRPIGGTGTVGLFTGAAGAALPLSQDDLTDASLITFSGWYAAA